MACVIFIDCFCRLSLAILQNNGRAFDSMCVGIYFNSKEFPLFLHAIVFYCIFALSYNKDRINAHFSAELLPR